MLIFPQVIEESDEYPFDSAGERKMKLFRELSLPLLAFVLLTAVIIAIRSLLTPSLNRFRALSETEGFDNDDYSAIDTSDYELKSHFFSRVNHAVYSGNWSSHASSGEDSSSGLAYMRISSNRNIRPNALTIIIRAFDGSYANHWKEISINPDLNSITLLNSSKSFSLEANLSAMVDINDVTDVSTKVANCSMAFQLTFLQTPSSNGMGDMSQSRLSQVIGKVISQCQLNLSFALSLEGEEEALSDFRVITGYSVALSLLLCLSFANTIWLNVKVIDKESYANSICLLTVYQNVIWNSYGCLTHFFLSINSVNYLTQFLIPTLLCFINFAISDLKLLHSLWSQQYSRLLSNPLLIKKKLVQVYSLFYVLLFFSLFYVNQFYFSKGYIAIGVILTWMPQIIYNALYDVSISMPGLSVLVISINRLFFPCYCRAYSGNCFLIKPDYAFVAFCLVLMALMIGVMQLQMWKGSRWFLPRRWRGEEWEYYRSTEELLGLKEDALKTDCVICLNRLIDSNLGTNYFNSDFNLKGKEAYDALSAYQNRASLREKLQLNLFHFKKRALNVGNKPFMLTQCNHVFHADCLELWIIRKKECPHCRKELSLG